MIQVPITVVGEGPLAATHRRVYDSHVACQLLHGDLPGREGVVDLCGPPELCAEVLGTLLRQRIPLALSLPTQWSANEIARLAQAAHKRRVPTAALGSLRVFPAAARLKEVLSSGVLGELRSLRLRRSGVDRRPVTGEPDQRLAEWRDADLCRWLAGDSNCEVEISADDQTGQAEREVTVTATLGEMAARFQAGKLPEVTVCTAGRQRQRRVPALGREAAHLAELQLLVAARQCERPWLLLPSLADVVATMAVGPSTR